MRYPEVAVKQKETKTLREDGRKTHALYLHADQNYSSPLASVPLTSLPFPANRCREKKNTSNQTAKGNCAHLFCFAKLGAPDSLREDLIYFKLMKYAIFQLTSIEIKFT